MASARRPELFPAQRRSVVLEHIRKRGAASIQELAGAIGISISTVRRDLEQLEAGGYLERAHGGALVQKHPRSTFEPDAAIAAQLSRPEKEAIGWAAAGSLASGESVIFDSSSTVLAAARACIERDLALTAVTNDLGIGQVLAGSPKMRVVILGGTVRSGSSTMVGDPGHDFLRDLRADVAFVGVHAIAEGALSETSFEAAAMKRAMIAAARRVVLLADSSKFQPAAFRRICGVEAVHELITDYGVEPAHVTRLRDAGVTVTVVAVNGSSTETS